MLKGKQKKLDKNKDGKISGEDFKIMSPKKAALGALMIGKAMKKKDKAMPVGLGAALAKKDMLKKMTKAKDGKSVKTSKTLEKFAGKNTMKDLGQLKAALSEKELDFIKGLNKSKGSMTAKEKEVMNRYKDDVVPNYSKGGAMKKASKGSMISSEGPTNKVRGTGIAVRGTNFKGVF